jgi:hypothetical protein
MRLQQDSWQLQRRIVYNQNHGYHLIHCIKLYLPPEFKLQDHALRVHGLIRTDKLKVLVAFENQQ